MAKGNPRKTSAEKRRKNETVLFVLDLAPINYLIGAVGILLMIVGYFLMAGGRSEDPTQFHPEEVYAWRRITLAPLLVIAGYILQFVAIFYRGKQRNGR